MYVPYLSFELFTFFFLAYWIKEASQHLIQTPWTNLYCRWHQFDTDVLSCQQKGLVPATVSHRKDLIEKIYKLVPGGTSELE